MPSKLPPGRSNAVITIADRQHVFHVLIEGPGNPRSVTIAFLLTLSHASKPFDASEWAAAFIVATKSPGPSFILDASPPADLVRLTSDWRNHHDLSHRYLVTDKNGGLWISALSSSGAGHYTQLYEGDLNGLCEFVEIADSDRQAVAEEDRDVKELARQRNCDPATIDDLMRILESGYDHAEVRIAILGEAIRQWRVAGMHMVHERRLDGSVCSIAWLVAGSPLGDVPIDFTLKNVFARTDD